MAISREKDRLLINANLYHKDLGAAPAFMGGGEVYMRCREGQSMEHFIRNSFRDRKYFEVTSMLQG